MIIAAATARRLDAGTKDGDASIAGYLTCLLGEPVHVAGVKFSRANVRGDSTMFTIRPGHGLSPG